MFKRLRERITEEAITRFPVGQYGLNQSPGRSSLDPSAVNTENVSEDLITLSDSSSVVVPHTSPQQFSIADEDGSFSEPNTPQKLKMDCSAGSEQFCTPNSTADELQQISPEAHVLPKYQPSNKKSYVPQSDIESEVEEPPTLRLDGISKEQLTMANEALKAKMYKYKQKYSEVVVKYKELNDEKVKIEHILTESQDKALRRIAELKEQCQLEQNAKAHLEENLRLILEEKEDMISVLQTKINLLKDGVNVDNAEVVSQSSEKRELKIPIEKTDGDSREPEQSENLALKEKITRLQALLEKCKSTIKDNKEKMSSLIKENETISQMLQEKSNELEKMKGKEMDYQDQLHNMQLCLKEHEEQQEESAMSMAETKKNMHEELEIKEQQLRKAKEEMRTFQMSIDAEKQTLEDFKKQHEEAVNELQSKLKNTEKAMEEEKQNLMHELSRGKAAAVTLMQQECAKKLLLAEVDWEAKLKEVQIQKEKNFLDKEKDMSDKLLQNEAALKKYDLELEKLNSELKQLKCEKEHTKIEEDVNTGIQSEIISRENRIEIEAGCEQNIKICHIISPTEGEISVLKSDQDVLLPHDRLKENTLQHFGEGGLNISNLTDTINTSNKIFGNLSDIQVPLDIFLPEKGPMMKCVQKCSKELEILNEFLYTTDHIIEELSNVNEESNIQIINFQKEIAEMTQNLKISTDCLVSSMPAALANIKLKLEMSYDKCNKVIHQLGDYGSLIKSLKRGQVCSKTAVGSLSMNVHVLENSNLELLNQINGLQRQCDYFKDESKRLMQDSLDVVSLKKKLNEDIKMEKKNSQKQRSIFSLVEKKMLEFEILEIDTFNEIYYENDYLYPNSGFEAGIINSEGHNEGNENSFLSFETSIKSNANSVDNVFSDWAKILTEECLRAIVIGKQLKIYENKVCNLKLEVQNLKSVNMKLYEKLLSNEKSCSVLLEEKYCCSKKILELQYFYLLSTWENDKMSLHAKIQNLEDCLKKSNSCLSNQDFMNDKQNAELHEQVEMLKSLLGNVETENKSLKNEIISINQLLESINSEYATKMSCLQQSLCEVEEEKNNLSIVLQNIERERGFYHESGSKEVTYDEKKTIKISANSKGEDEMCVLSEKENFYLQQIDELKGVVRGLQCQETEENNLLQRTKNDYENIINKLNLEVQNEISTLNSQIDRLTSELHCLSQQLECSKKYYENIIGQIASETASKLSELAYSQKEYSEGIADDILLREKMKELQSKLIAGESSLNSVFLEKDALDEKLDQMEEKSLTKECEYSKTDNDVVEKLNALVMKLKISIDRKEEEHNRVVSELRHSLLNEMKVRLENESLLQKDTEEKLHSLLYETTKQLEECTLLREKETQEITLAKEWENKYNDLVLKTEVVSSHVEKLQCLIQEKEDQLSRSNQNVNQLNSHLQTMHQNVTDLTEEFSQERQDYEVQVHDLTESVSEAKITIIELQEMFRHCEQTLEQKTIAFKKIKESLVDKWKRKVAAVNKKFIERLNQQQIKYRKQLEKLKDLQKLLDENSVLKLAVEEMDNSLKQNVCRVKEVEAMIEMKDIEICNLQHDLVLKEDCVQTRNSQISDLSDIISDLRNTILDYQNVFSPFVPGEPSPKILSNYLIELKEKMMIAEGRTKDLEINLFEHKEVLSTLENKNEEFDELNLKFKFTMNNWNASEAKCVELTSNLQLLRNDFKVLLDEKEKEVQQLVLKVEELRVSLEIKCDEFQSLEEKFRSLMRDIQEKENAHVVQLNLLSCEHEKQNATLAQTNEALVQNLNKLKGKAELKLTKLKENLVFEKEQALKYIEAELSLTKSTYMKDIEGLKTKIAQLETLNANLEIEKENLQASRLKMENVIEELNLEMTSTMKCKEIEYEKIQTERDEYLSVLSETIKDRENIILQLKRTLSSTEISHQEKMHELNDRIKQLEFQQEKLMLQAQERVSTTEAECREIVDHLKEKISILQSEKLDTEVLKSEIGMLNSQVEQSILDSETNQFAFTEELSSLRSQLNDVKKVLSNTLEAHAVNESELLNKLKKLESENLQFLEDRKCLDILKEEKEHLNQKLKDLEEKSYTEPIMEEIALLKEENVRLQREVELLAPLKSEKELLNEKISLENNKKDLSDKIIQVEVQNNQLSTSYASDDIFNVKLVSLENELTSVKEENFLLLNKIHLLEQNTPYDPNSAYFKQYVDLIKSEFEGKLSMKDTEMETKLKQLVKDFCGQLNVKDKDYDQVISEIIEKSQCQEEQLLRNHRIEIASLRQDIFEKDCALEEMREHYEEIVQEKDAKLKEYGGIWKAGNPSNFDLCPEAKKGEHSDWDDGWVVCEENTENASPLHCNKTECAVHVRQIDELQEEVAKCNSEIKDLRILLCLNPPQSPSSNNNYSNSLPCLPEPTEFEYLRNILFEYMMGKETLTLVKVIAAVLRFSEEQTQLVLQKEELRRTMRAHWLSF